MVNIVWTVIFGSVFDFEKFFFVISDSELLALSIKIITAQLNTQLFRLSMIESEGSVALSKSGVTVKKKKLQKRMTKQLCRDTFIVLFILHLCSANTRASAASSFKNAVSGFEFGKRESEWIRKSVVADAHRQLRRDKKALQEQVQLTRLLLKVNKFDTDPK